MSTTNGDLFFAVPPPNGERAWRDIDSAADLGEGRRNFTLEKQNVVIHNLRGNESSASVDVTGYQLIHSPAKHTAFTDDEAIKREYYPDVIAAIKKATGASRVVLYDHTIRRRRPGELDDGPNRRQPVPQTHVDQTNKSAVDRVHLHIPAAEVPDVLSKRWQLINLWRPIGNPAHDWPLALADFRSVDAKNDMLPVALVYPDHEGETYSIKYNPKMRWTYFKGVTTEEAVLIKCYDSKQDGSVAMFTPHTAFADPQTPADAPLRESIEVRAIVLYD